MTNSESKPGSISVKGSIMPLRGLNVGGGPPPPLRNTCAFVSNFPFPIVGLETVVSNLFSDWKRPFPIYSFHFGGVETDVSNFSAIYLKTNPFKMVRNRLTQPQPIISASGSYASILKD